MGLTSKQQAFVEYYLQCWNASEAARQAGYSERTAGAAGVRLLKDVNIAAEISTRLAVMTMGADEALVRLAEQARAAYASYIQADGRVDLAGLKRAGKMHLIKGIKPGKFGDTIEFADAQAALFKIAQVHGLLVDRVEARVETVDNAAELFKSRMDSIAAKLAAEQGDSGTGSNG